MVIVRPDLWVGMSTLPVDVKGIGTYFEEFLIPVKGDYGTDGVHEGSA